LLIGGSVAFAFGLLIFFPSDIVLDFLKFFWSVCGGQMFLPIVVSAFYEILKQSSQPGEGFFDE
jgi:hypothetical protein